MHAPVNNVVIVCTARKFGGARLRQWSNSALLVVCTFKVYYGLLFATDLELLVLAVARLIVQPLLPRWLLRLLLLLLRRICCNCFSRFLWRLCIRYLGGGRVGSRGWRRRRLCGNRGFA